ncbi:unnamed protein product [Peronospora farinosa]|uniref:Uncharacterized protein n=1 Tax=Peronospora farinosa TaxID=134698 RepID=A0AAV0TEB6_9STRA|nr:unnamed protein product [Peronospora farinosa]
MEETSRNDVRPRRGLSRTTRSTFKSSRRVLSKVPHDGGSSADEEDEEEEEEEEEEIEEEEEEIEEEEDEPVDEAEEAELDAIDAAYRISPTARELHTLEQGTLVRILKTPDVEQRVPHTMNKIGVVEEVPHHPNTWYKVRIRDGDVVYKYRPSALESIETSREEEEEEGEDEEEEQEHKKKDDHLEPGTRVVIKLEMLYGAEKRYLKNYDGKEGVVTGHGKAGVVVQLDADEDIALTLHRKHLMVVPEEEDDGEEEEEEQSEDEQQDDKKKRPAVPHMKKRLKGKLLSVLDPDMWIDRRCRINVGKFKGQRGRVLRSGNGWVQLKLENSSENTAKRAYELTLLEDLETIKVLFAKTLEKERKRRAEGRVNGIIHRRDDGDEEDNDEEASHSGTDDALAAEQTEDSQGEDDSGKRLRRVSTRGNYGISWIERKVNLPHRKGYGIVKKADRDTCTVEIQATKVIQVFKKKDLQLANASLPKTARQNSRNRNNAKAREKLGLHDDAVLMGTTPSRYIAFQDVVKRFALRRREKLKKRPNLIEWQARLNLNYLENGHWDKSNPSVIDLVVVSQCEICGVEKEEMNGHCWNNECPRCPVFDVDKFDPKDENAIMRVPVTPFANDTITTSLCFSKEDLSRKRKRRILETALAEAAERNEVDTEQLISPTLEPKEAIKDAPKPKKTPIAVTDKDEKPTRKKPGKVSCDRSEPKSKAVTKKAKSKRSSRNEVPTAVTEAAENGETSPTGAFRPRYDSVFTR